MPLKAPVYDINGQKISDLVLPKTVFSVTAPQSLIDKSIRVYLSNQRTAHAKSKNRAEVSGTTQKMWAQKGTGRARHGSRKAPIFVGGGVAHGPSGNQNNYLKLNKKTKTQVIKAILSLHAQNGSILVVDQISKFSPKTKLGHEFLDKLRKDNKILKNSKKISLITTKSLNNPRRAFRNLPYLTLLNTNSLNVFNLSSAQFLIFSLKAINSLKK